jgi:hypothetical protein
MVLYRRGELAQHCVSYVFVTVVDGLVGEA